MFIKIQEGKIIKSGKTKKGYVIPLINVDEEKIYVVKFINDENYEIIKEYDFDSPIGNIYWNMINLKYYEE